LNTQNENDLSGGGTASDPYVVHSTNGFLWLAKKINFNGKNIVLDCDIILNDEVFDEDGNPSGGDGYVYSWYPIQTGNSATVIDGKGHKIVGMYYNDNTQKHIGLFGYNFGGTCQNISFENLFLFGKEYVRSVGTFCKEITNCKTQGAIKAENNCAGICYNSAKVENCINYANITSVTGGVAGGIATRGTMFLNCKNHGDVSAKQQVGGILAFETPLSLRIEGCDNYGDVKATEQYYAGGIIGLAYTQQSNLMIKNCNNYGDVYAEKGYVAGIIGFAEGYLDVVNCTNKGDVNWIDLHGELVGAFRAQYGNVKDSYLRIINSKVEKNVDYSSEDRFVGGFYNAKDSMKIEILNCSVKINVIGNKNYNFIVVYIPANIDLVSVKNLDIVLISENSTPKISILSNKPNIQTKYDFENINVYIKAPSDNAVQLFSGGEYGDNVKVDGVVSTVVTPQKAYKTYYGNNFSGFFSYWKNSEIGLKAFSGKGFYQRNVTEEYLTSKGYEKKVI